jgi:hypothetical protein
MGTFMILQKVKDQAEQLAKRNLELQISSIFSEDRDTPNYLVIYLWLWCLNEIHRDAYNIVIVVSQV